jgi:hypothetical protein
VKSKPKQLTFVLILLSFFLWQTPASAEPSREEKVESVEVQLNIDGKIYEGLQERIEYSISRVGDKILLSQPISLLKNSKETLRTVIINVFSKVLVGFKVDSVDLFLAQHTKVVIHLIPVPPLISELKLNLEVRNLAPEIVDFSKGISGQIEAELNRIFVGFPVASVAWSEGIFSLVAEYLVERELPGFDSRFSIIAGAKTELNLTLIPREPTVSGVTIKYTSSNVPTYLVRQKAKVYLDKFNVLKGIPVEFLVHYQPQLEKELTRVLNDFPELRQLGLAVTLKIKPALNTQVQLGVDSENYPFKLEARYFIGGETNFGNFQGYLGYSTDDYELFTRCYVGHNPTGNYFVGCKVPMMPNLTGGFEYELEHHTKDLWFHYQFERGDYFDLRWMIDGSPNEALIGIFINDHANLELVDYDDNFGIQVMFHF